MGFPQVLGFGIAFSIPLGFLLMTVISPKMAKYHLLCKTVSSLAFILVAICCGAMNESWKMLGAFLPALAFCFWGDVMLAKNEENQKDSFFLTGLGSFLIGHIVFVVAFDKVQPIMWQEFIFPIIVSVIAILVSNLKKYFTIGKMVYAVAVYAFFVGWLFSKGTLLAAMNMSPQTMMLSIGAGLFFISDVIILFICFYYKKYLWLRIVNLTMYYYGVFLISSSLLFF